MTQPLALYVHIPFCTAKCTYCDFNSYAGQESLIAPYAEAVAREAALWSPRLAGRQVETVFFGGGTPSILPLPEMSTIVEAMRSRFDIAPDAEVTLEANPGTVDATHLEGLRRLGFNRISFGVQSFHDDELIRLERIHDREEVHQAYAWARAAGFENVNLDLIYGLAGQTLELWQENVEQALALAPEHLSMYALTLEEGTPLTRDVERGRAIGPDPDLQADMYEWSRERMAAAGYAYYEVSNWSKPGRECRHNLTYWRNGDWLGLGAGAHSHLAGERFAAAASPSRYIALINEASEAASSVRPEPVEGREVPQTMRQITFREPADPQREMSETVILALRLREGLSLASFRDRFGVDLDTVFAAPLQETLDLGLTELVEGRLRLRDEAVLLGDEAFLRFLPD
ncbi:MAG TPA: radical SAM family heme chaperone HemW [Dehalococcoidia bacterium]|nr:radical SAM family heme chaperone HemW [Dehalococcoidia bacterium]